MARRGAQATLKEIGITLLLLLVIVWLIFLVIGIFHKEQIARTIVGETRAQLAALDTRKATLANTVNNLNTERGQEESVRETYGVAKPGEDVVIVVPKNDILPPPPLTTWQKVLKFFGF